MCDISTQTILVEDIGAVRVVTMNRPSKLNALNSNLTRSLEQALHAAEAEPSIRAIVLTGAGRAFCVGADLSEFKDLTAERPDLVNERAELTCRVHMALQQISKPIVSAVRGAAVGGGAGLAIGCDMMVVATDIKFGYPEIKHSVIPALVMTGLRRQLGRKIAFELVSLGRLLDADDVVRLGLANRVVASDGVLDAAVAIAQGWANANSSAMACLKALFYEVEDLAFEPSMMAGRDANIAMRGFKAYNPD